MIKILLCNLIQCQWEHLYESLYDCVSCPVYIVLILMLFHYGWEHLYESLYVLSCIYCRASYAISLRVCVSESICMKVCMSCPVDIVVLLMLFHYGFVSVRASVWKFVCLVLYILSYLCYFITGVCQWEHLYESLYVLSCRYCRASYAISLRVCVIESICMKVCMSCPVDIVVLLMLFHYGCVSVRASVWKFVCLVLYILSYLCYFITGLCQWEHLYESLYVLSCIYCRASYAISLRVCVSESICMKVCMSCPVDIVVLLMLFHYGCVSVRASYESLYVLSCIYCRTYAISLRVCVSESICMKVCMSCPVYIVVLLMLFHYGCVSVRASVWKFVCLVLYILSYLCYFITGVCQWEHLYESLYVLSCRYCRASYAISLRVCVSESICMKVCMSCPVYIVVLMLFHYGCVSLRASVWKFVCLVL